MSPTRAPWYPARAKTRTAASSSDFRFSSDAIERSVNADEDESTLPRGATARGNLVVDLTRLLPGAYASRELRRRGARVVRVEAPEGDAMRATAPAVGRGAPRRHGVGRLRPEGGRCVREEPLLPRRRRARGLPPGRRSSGSGSAAGRPRHVVYCSITGFGLEPEHAQRAGHDLNYLGWAGVLEDTAPGLPVQVADLSAGALGAVTASSPPSSSGAHRPGEHVTVSMTHGAHDLVAHRLGGDTVPRLLTGGLACYRVYGTADGRLVTVGALEPKFFRRLCELVERPELAERQYAETRRRSQASSRGSSRAALAEWLDLFDGEDVCVGPRVDAGGGRGHLRTRAVVEPVPLGAHTEAWRRALAGEPEGGG